MPESALARKVAGLPFFLHDGIEFHYDERGSGPPLLFSHGLGADLNRSLELTAGILEARLILYDNRNHGGTRPLVNAERLTFAHMADDMLALLDHLSVPRAILGGVSMGAGIALRCALQRPDRARALILNRPAWLDRPYPPNLAFAPMIADLFRKFGPQEGLMRFERARYYTALEREYPASARGLCETLASADPEALASAYEGIPASTPMDSLSSLRMLDVPALVLGCRNDPFHPFEMAEMWAAALPRAHFCVLPPREDWPAHVREFRQQVTEYLSTLD